MSWSAYGSGRPKALKALLLSRLAQSHCSEPEETVKANIGGVIGMVLDNAPETAAYDIKASGSQNSDGTNTVNLTITPLWGFVE